MKLVLFDIDGTLVRANRAGRVAMQAALIEILGTAGTLESYDMSGQLDPVIIRAVLQAAGVADEAITAALPDVYRAMAEKGGATYRDHGMIACPGVIPLLEHLHLRADVTLGLLTGNIPETAPLKLIAAGIDPGLFRFGAYGTDGQLRDELPAAAWQRAADSTGRRYAGKDTVIVGDTPADIACALRSGSRAVAVATGHFSAATLAEYRPHAVLEDLADLEAALEAILGKQRKPASEKKPRLAGVTLKSDGPTILSFEQLHTWVIWQYPRRRGGGLAGAVRPPIPHRGWLPAVIRTKEGTVEVYGHLGRDFPDPHAAADWLFP